MKFVTLYTLLQIRFFPRYRKEPYLFWTKLLGFTPQNIKYYDLALCHKSLNVSKKTQGLTNERLEFLGDAILSAIVANILYKKFPDKGEGFLTRTRSKIVCRASLNSLAKRMGLDAYIKKSPNITQDVENIYGNALEALIGAIYLDRGYDVCTHFIEEHLVKYGLINLDKIVAKETDFKSRLYEWAQKKQKKLVFEMRNEEFNSATHQYVFRYRIYIDDVVISESEGKTKKIAQQDAARLALHHIRKQKL